MATFIPSIGTCSFETAAECRLAERLEQKLDKLGQQLVQKFGRGFESCNLRRMVKFAESFPDTAIVSTLSTQLSWSHMVAIVAPKTPQARQFYASQAASGWRGAGCCWGTWMKSDDMKVSKGLEFPVVALAGVGHSPPGARTSKRPRGCFMWRRQGLRRGS